MASDRNLLEIFQTGLHHLSDGLFNCLKTYQRKAQTEVQAVPVKV